MQPYRLLLVKILLILSIGSQAYGETFPFAGKRIVFLGDSITHAGTFIVTLDVQLQASSIDAELVNLGLGSETCSGLTETDHPFPRPCVIDRIDRVFEKAEPEVLVVCYGINDAIYAPLDQTRFAAYKKGINTILSKAEQHNVPVVLCTPPPFDAVPAKKQGTTRSIDGSDFSWKHIYEDYDDVLATYSQWIRDQGDRVTMVVDLRSAVADYLATQRRSNPDLILAHDGIHLNAQGHSAISAAFVEAWSIPDAQATAELQKTVTRNQGIMHLAWLSHVGHKRPKVKPGLPLEEARKLTTSTDR